MSTSDFEILFGSIKIGRDYVFLSKRIPKRLTLFLCCSAPRWLTLLLLLFCYCYCYYYCCYFCCHQACPDLTSDIVNGDGWDCCIRSILAQQQSPWHLQKSLEELSPVMLPTPSQKKTTETPLEISHKLQWDRRKNNRNRHEEIWDPSTDTSSPYHLPCLDDCTSCDYNKRTMMPLPSWRERRKDFEEVHIHHPWLLCILEPMLLTKKHSYLKKCDRIVSLKFFSAPSMSSNADKLYEFNIIMKWNWPGKSSQLEMWEKQFWISYQKEEERRDSTTRRESEIS